MRKTQQKQQRKKSRSTPGQGSGRQPKRAGKPFRQSGRGVGGNSSLSLNAIQTTFVNPNSFWEIRPSSTPGGMIIKAREPLGSVSVGVIAAGAFTIATIAGASGLPLACSPFPRLNNISAAYEHYKFRRARLDFMSALPTTATGQILMWTDYVAVDTVATTSGQALSNITSVIANIYSSVSCEALGALSRLPKYVINQNSDVNVEQTLQANMYIAVQGFVTAAATTIGELMVEYEVELFTPSQINGTVLRNRKDNLERLELINQIKKCSDDEECHRLCNLLCGKLNLPIEPRTFVHDCAFESYSKLRGESVSEAVEDIPVTKSVIRTHSGRSLTTK